MGMNPAAAAFAAEVAAEERKENVMLSERAVTLLLRAEAMEFPAVFFAGGSSHLAGEDAWRRKLADVAPGYYDEIGRQLDAHASQLTTRERSDEAEAERETRLAEAARPLDVSDPFDLEAAAVAARRRAAEEEAEAEAQPATVAQLDKLIGVAEAILAELKAK